MDIIQQIVPYLGSIIGKIKAQIALFTYEPDWNTLWNLKNFTFHLDTPSMTKRFSWIQESIEIFRITTLGELFPQQPFCTLAVVEQATSTNSQVME